MLIFDDTAVHEAWSRAEQTRAVLLFDFRRPGQQEAEPDVAPAAVREFVVKRTKQTG